MVGREPQVYGWQEPREYSLNRGVREVCALRVGQTRVGFSYVLDR